MERTKKTVPLGSGLLYLAELKEDYIPAPAALEALATDENQIGETTGGATLTYTASIHKEQDDHGRLNRVIVTDEEGKLKSGVFSWAPNTLEKLVSTARVCEIDGYRVLKLGGLGNDNGKRYIVIFKHIDPKYGDLFVAMVGTNTAGLSLAFARNNTTKLEPEFTAQPCDKEGTLILMFEKLPEAAANAQSDGGSASSDPAGDGTDEQTA